MIYQSDCGDIIFIHDVVVVYRVLLPQKSEITFCEIEGEIYALQELKQLELDYLKTELDAYFSGEQVEFSAPTSLKKIPLFSKTALQMIKKLRWGETASYGEVARRAGNPKGARAVGQAMSRNPCPLLIPCHRVITHDGKLGGFSGMIDIKKQLLNLEGINL